MRCGWVLGNSVKDLLSIRDFGESRENTRSALFCQKSLADSNRML